VAPPPATILIEWVAAERAAEWPATVRWPLGPAEEIMAPAKLGRRPARPVMPRVVVLELLLKVFALRLRPLVRLAPGAVLAPAVMFPKHGCAPYCS